MTDEEDTGVYECVNGLDLYKDSENEKIWWVDTPDTEGQLLFTFDKKTVFNFWTDYPKKLTEEQIKIFQKENPVLAELKPLKTPRQTRDNQV